MPARRRAIPLLLLFLVPVILACGAESVRPDDQGVHGGIDGLVLDSQGQPAAGAAIGMLFDIPVPEGDWPPGGGARSGASVRSGGERQPSNGLFQNYPNPFNPATTLRFTLAESRPFILSIRDLRGETLRTLWEDISPPGGSFEIVWDGKDEDGDLLPQGCYSARLQIGIGENAEIHEVHGVAMMSLNQELWDDFAVVWADAEGRFHIPASKIPIGIEVPLTTDSPQVEEIHSIGHGMWLTCVHGSLRELVPVEISSLPRDVFVEINLPSKDDF